MRLSLEFVALNTRLISNSNEAIGVVLFPAKVKHIANSMPIMLAVRTSNEVDASRILAIFAEGIATGIATFETECPDWAGFNQRFLPAPRLVAELDGQVLGWAVLSAVSARACYRGVAELSVYVASAAQGRGVGRQLLQALITESEAAGFWMLQGTINRRNVASIALHERCGFRQVGYRERIAQRDGEWQDTVVMERRSKRVGID